jgi:putative ABC transport system permease protein
VRLLLRSWIWKPRIEDEVDGELAFHLEMRTREYLAQGLTPDEARLAALARFGDVARANALCRELGGRRDRSMSRQQYLSELRQDITFASRQLLRNLGFAIIATLTLALGIGGTAAIFSVVNAVILKPLPLREPARIVRIWETFRQWHTNVTAGSVDAWRTRGSDVFDSVAGLLATGFNLADDGGVERVNSAAVTEDYFRVFGVEPLLGRTLGSADDTPGTGQVTVLSEQLWRRRFGADPNVLGRDVRLNGRPYRIVGVMPASFRLTAQAEELWVPTAFTPEQRASFARRFLIVFARLKPGVTREQAQAQASIVTTQIKKEHNDTSDRRVVVNAFLDDFLGASPQRLFVLLGAVGFVLLIGCANVANLLLARGTTRASELAVRAALGAGRGRVIRQLLTENAVLAALGAAAGLALAVIIVRALVLFAPADVPRLDEAHLDPMTLAITAFIAIASSLLFGLAPVRRAMSQHAGDVLKGGRSGDLGMARDRVRQVLVIVEVALALVLLAGAGLLIRTAIALQRVDLGFEPTGVLSARVSLPTDGYEDPLKVRQTFERIADEAHHAPGAQSVDLITRAPLSGLGTWILLHREGEPYTYTGKDGVNAGLRVITPGYLQTMRIRLKEGRAFTNDDREGAPKVIIVSEFLARQLWPGVSPIGKRVDCCGTPEHPEWMTIVGVAADVRGYGPAMQPDPEYYLPLQQAPAGAWTINQRTMYMVARAADPTENAGNPASANAGNPAATTTTTAAMTAGLREAVARVDRTLPLFDVQTMDQRLSDTLSTAHFVTGLLTTLGAIGLLLAAIGIYGVMAYSVSQRTQEIGLRLALGAAPNDVLLLVTRQAIKPVLIGVIAGFVLAFAAAKLIEGQLIGVTPHDPATFILVTLLLVAVSIVATIVPARRAAHVDPTRALGAS